VKPLYTNGVGVGYVAAAWIDCSEWEGWEVVENGELIGEIWGFLGFWIGLRGRRIEEQGLGREKQQIPCGNDGKKGKGKSNDKDNRRSFGSAALRSG
jgi:hypothetical protein